MSETRTDQPTPTPAPEEFRAILQRVQDIAFDVLGFPPTRERSLFLTKLDEARLWWREYFEKERANNA